MIIPKFGTFTNGPYTIKGFALFGKINGIVIESYYPSVYEVGRKVSIPEYHLPDDDDPQFYISK